MISDVNIGEFLRLGGIYKDIGGATAIECFDSICKKINLPQGLSARHLYEALCQRESVLSTAVGKGFAIPHSQQPLVKRVEDQRIYICYLKDPIDMQAMDSKRVSTMIIPLSCSVQAHLHIISRLARLLQNPQFKNALETRQDLNVIFPLTRQF